MFDARPAQVEHLREVRDAGPLTVGCEAGVFDASAPSQPLALAAVDPCDLYAAGEPATTREQWMPVPDLGSGVAVPADGLAEVAIAEGAAPFLRDRHVRILVDLDPDNELWWAPRTRRRCPAPARADVAQPRRRLDAAASAIPPLRYPPPLAKNDAAVLETIAQLGETVASGAGGLDPPRCRTDCRAASRLTGGARGRPRGFPLNAIP